MLPMPAKRTTKRKEVTQEINEPTMQSNNSSPFTPSPRLLSNLMPFLLIIVSFFAGYLFFKVKSLERGGAQVQGGAAQPTLRPVSLDDIKKLYSQNYIKFGDANRKVLFVEITDPSCPFCHIAGGKNPQLSKDAGKFQYVSDGGTYTPPLPEIRKLVEAGKASFLMIYGTGHGNGRLGTEALYCANEKGKFWEVHDRLLSNDGYVLLNEKVKNDKANIPLLVDFLSKETDQSALKDCLDSGKYTQTLVRDEQTDQLLNFHGTPQFYVNATPFNGAYDYKDMQSAVNSAL